MSEVEPIVFLLESIEWHHSPTYQGLVSVRVLDGYRREAGMAWLQVRKKLLFGRPVREWYDPLETKESYDRAAAYTLEGFKMRGYRILTCQEAAARLREEKYAQELRSILVREFKVEMAR